MDADQRVVEFFYRRFLLPNLKLFCHSAAEREMLHFLMDCTIRFGNISTTLTPEAFKIGRPSAFIFGFPYWTQRYINKLKINLKQLGYIIFDERVKHKSAREYRINLPAFYRTLKRLTPFTSEEIIADFQNVEEVLDKLYPDQELNCTVDKNRIDAIEKFLADRSK